MNSMVNLIGLTDVKLGSTSKPNTILYKIENVGQIIPSWNMCLLTCKYAEHP